MTNGKQHSAQHQQSRSARRAKLLRDGHSWRSACLLSGYSLSAANRGPKNYFEGSPGVRREFTRLVEEEAYSPDVTRKIAKNRLTKAVVEGKSSNVAREIELLGRFKEHDWWVRASDVQVGIFGQLCDPEMGRILDEAQITMAAYADADDAPAEPTGESTEKQRE